MALPGFFQAGSMMFTGDPTAGFNVEGTTIHPGGPAVTVSGNTISLQPSGNVVIDGSSKQITTVTIGPVSQPKFTAFLTQTTGGAVVACIPELTTSGKSTITQCRGSWQSTTKPGTAPARSTTFLEASSKVPSPTQASGSPKSAKPAQSTKQATTARTSTFPSSAISNGQSGSTEQSRSVIQPVSLETTEPVVPPGTVKPSGSVKSSGSVKPSGSVRSTESSKVSESANETGSVASGSRRPSRSVQSGSAKSSSGKLVSSANTINSLGPSGISNSLSRSLVSSTKPTTTGPVSGVPTAKSGLAPSTYKTRPGSQPVSRSASQTDTVTKSTGGSQLYVVPSTVLEVTASNAKVTTTLVSAISITTTITPTPPGFSASTTSNPAWTSDTVATISGTMYPVLVNYGSFCGPPGSAVLPFGLGGLPSDPIRPGCGEGGLLGLFRSIFSCSTLFDFGSFPSFFLNINGIPELEPDPAQNPTPAQNPSPNSNPNPSPSGSPTGTKASKSASTSSCKSTAITTCTQKVGLITSISGTSTTVRSGTTSECTAITACSGNPTKIATTT
ncbi:hypothetical protein MMC15_000872, partial [Xylographa vitiligo]|nr:hypothetical protein [Xylographa vitiligo]